MSAVPSQFYTCIYVLCVIRRVMLSCQNAQEWVKQETQTPRLQKEKTREEEKQRKMEDETAHRQEEEKRKQQVKDHAQCDIKIK